jgi:hypothetical protein
VLLDMVMPGVSGFEVVRELHAWPETSTVPIVVCGDNELNPAERDVLRGQVEAIVNNGAGTTDILLELLQLERFYPRLAKIVGGPSGHAVAGHFRPHVERELNRAQRHGRPFSVVWINVVDPEPGASAEHSRYLGELCAAFATELRRHDLVVHDELGEIFLLLPDLGPTGTSALVSRLLSTAWSFQPTTGQSVSRVAIGYACYPADAQTVGALLDTARAQRAEHARGAVAA